MANRARSRARGWSLQVLYAAESRGAAAGPHAVLEAFLVERRIAAESRPYLRALVGTVAEHRDDIDRAIEGALTNWRLERLSAIDRAILRIGAAELLFVADVPARVAIQEAIILAEKYGTTESPRFVNGVLDALARAHGAVAGKDAGREA
ncbi:MAG TPA: transcription antitermination factor NusB [Longimicrobiales bacterium]|nr:transcription antitermination factor NusB [Longimicrobiales bacterium]